MLEKSRKTAMKQRLAGLSGIVTWALCLILVAPVVSVQAAGPVGEGVPLATDLKNDAELAKQKKGVVLVLFSQEHCGYCQRVLNEFLIPMSRNMEYQQKLVMRDIDSRGSTMMRDFDGKLVDHNQFSRKHGVRMVPSVMLFDTEGRRLTKPLIGLSTVDYYGSYLDDAIDQAIDKVKTAVAVTAK
jgi:thioredoxin-related protein